MCGALKCLGYIVTVSFIFISDRSQFCSGLLVLYTFVDVKTYLIKQLFKFQKSVIIFILYSNHTWFLAKKTIASHILRIWLMKFKFQRHNYI